MKMNTNPILYSFRRCPYAMRARLALFSCNIQVEIREILLKDKPDEMLSLSPKGTVPVLLLPDGRVLEESLDIMLWAATQKETSPKLATVTSPTEDMLSLIKQIDGPFKHHLDRYKYANRYTDEAAVAEDHRDQNRPLLELLNQHLADNSYLFGQDISFADLAIAPFIRQFAHTDLNWFQAQSFPYLQNWLDRFLGSAYFKAVMVKYPAWKEQKQQILLLS